MALDSPDVVQSILVRCSDDGAKLLWIYPVFACVRARLYTFTHSRTASLISPRAVSLPVFLFVRVNWRLKAKMQYRRFKQTGSTDSLPSALYICAVKHTWASRCGVVVSTLTSYSRKYRVLIVSDVRRGCPESSRGQDKESTLSAWSAMFNALSRGVTFKALVLSAHCTWFCFVLLLKQMTIVSLDSAKLLVCVMRQS